MLKTIVIVLVVVIAALLLVAASQPDQFQVQRTTAIKAPPEKIFALVNHLPSWQLWSPYEKKDPDMQRQFSGPASGVGATYAWSGDSNVGKGDMKIAAATEPSKIVIELNFVEPMKAHNIAEFELVPAGDTPSATQVTWSMRGEQTYMGKVMGLIFNMDRMVGGDFETGLAALKELAEK